MVMLQIEYSFANSHQSLSASNFITLCNVSVSRDLLRAIIHCVFQNCMIARRRSLETETLQSIMKFDALKVDDYSRTNIQIVT